MDILNGYRSKEFETIVELSHKISRMLGNVDHDVDELLAKQPDEIASAVRTIIFGLPTNVTASDTAAFDAIVEKAKK